MHDVVMCTACIELHHAAYQQPVLAELHFCTVRSFEDAADTYCHYHGKPRDKQSLPQAVFMNLLAGFALNVPSVGAHGQL